MLFLILSTIVGGFLLGAPGAIIGLVIGGLILVIWNLLAFIGEFICGDED